MHNTRNQRCGKEEKLSKDVPITEENIRKRGEWMALRVIKYKLGIDGSRFFRNLYYGLVRDMDHCDAPDHTPGYVLSDSYDVAQEAMMFLSEHIGRGMSELQEV